MSSVESAELDGYLDVEEKEQKKLQSSTFLWLMSFILKHRRPLILGFSMILLGTFCTLLEPRILAYVIDEAIVPKRWDKLKMMVVVFILATCLRVVSAIQQGYFFEILGQRVTQDLRLRLFEHLQRMPIVAFDKNPAGRLLTRVTNDIASLNEMFSAGFVSMICNLLLVIGILIGLMTLDLKLGLIASSVFPALVIVSVYFSNRLRISYRASRSKLSALNAFLAENLSGMKTVHLFNRQKLHMARFQRLNEWYAEAQTMSIRVFALFQPTITVAAGLSIGLVIWFGGRETLNGTLKIGALVAYFSYILSLFQPVREIADKWNIFLSGMASAERVYSLLQWPTECEGECNSECDAKYEQMNHKPGHLPDPVPLSGLRGDIVFENVWFAYDGSLSHGSEPRWILKDFSLEIRAGERIGVVGHTGAGKTTLISLLMRLYEPQKGRILLDGKDLRKYDKRQLRASIGIVQQEVFLFSGSFEDNITFWHDRGKPIHLPSGMKKLLGSLSLKQKGDQVLQERGSNFSMGEKQIIAFARAFAADPKIWILDEATANMDSETEALLQSSLNEASQNRTTLLIAHRLATVQSADRIIVLNKGNLLESGNHIELMSKNGLYARLYRYQQAQTPTPSPEVPCAISNGSQEVNSISDSSA